MAKKIEIERIQREWHKRKREDRLSETHVLMFYAEQMRKNPSLLKVSGVKGDVYQYLKTICKFGE